MRWPLAALAVGLLALVLQDAFEVMLLPRRVQRRVRFMIAYFRTTWRLCTAGARRVRAGERREALLSHFGALSMLGLFAIWAGALILAFGVLVWAFEPHDVRVAPRALFDQLYMSGVTFFTLGYGDVVPHSGAARVVSVLEAGTGIGFIAVVIGYLPVLYQLFSRREAHIIQLDGRAGSPPTATAMLCRHAEGEGLDKLDDLLRHWEIWGSELLESHLSYPMLAYYRSQHHDQSWLGALGCVMDVCAVILVGGFMPPLQARMTFAMARQVLVEMARSFRVAPSRYDGGDRLDAAEYARMLESFAAVGLTWDAGEDGERSLRALRATYEPLLDGLARYLLVELPGWLPASGAVDRWERGHRGLLARRLVEQLGQRGEADAAGSPTPAIASRSWRHWRRQLGGPD